MNAINGEVAQRIDYDEYGNVLNNINQDFQPFGYASGLYDTQTKLVRFGARDYEASVGRWTAKDPIGFGGGETSLYGYVGNDPVNNNDPIGLGPDKLILPPDPSQLPPEWQIDPSHTDPNGTRMRNPNGDYLDFHKGRPGEPGWRGKDHYHPNGDEEHLEPGDECPIPNGEENQFSLPRLTQQQLDNIRNAGWVGVGGTIIIMILLIPVGI